LASRRKVPRFIAQQRAIERELRALWTLGIGRFPCLCLVRGRIRFVHIYAKERIATEIWGTSAFLHVNWFGEQIPPTLRDGDMAVVLGNLNTANLGTRISLQSALLIPKGGAALRKQVIEMLSKAVLAPKTYISAEEFDAMLDKRLKRKPRLTVSNS
jgi:hypothetical protein